MSTFQVNVGLELLIWFRAECPKNKECMYLFVKLIDGLIDFLIDSLIHSLIH